MSSLGNLEGRFNFKFGAVLCWLLHLRPGTLGVELMWRHTSKWGEPVRPRKNKQNCASDVGRGPGAETEAMGSSGGASRKSDQVEHHFGIRWQIHSWKIFKVRTSRTSAPPLGLNNIMY